MTKYRDSTELTAPGRFLDVYSPPAPHYAPDYISPSPTPIPGAERLVPAPGASKRDSRMEFPGYDNCPDKLPEGFKDWEQAAKTYRTALREAEAETEYWFNRRCKCR